MSLEFVGMDIPCPHCTDGRSRHWPHGTCWACGGTGAMHVARLERKGKELEDGYGEQIDHGLYQPMLDLSLLMELDTW